MRYLTTIPILTLLLLGGCYTAKKADKAIDKAQRNYPEVVAKKARSLYPCTTVRIDTAWQLHDTIIEIPCPEVPIIVDTVTLTDTIKLTNRVTVPVRVQLPQRVVTKYVEDSAKIYVLNSELATYSSKVQRLEQQLTDTTESRNKWRKWCFITWVLVAAFVGVYFLLPKLLNR